MARDANYDGREQSLVKHYILEQYLQKLAHIIGSWAETITYVDCFSGPWQSHADDLSDTSFDIALRELRKARASHSAHGKVFKIRCMFLEEQVRRYGRLKKYAEQQAGVEICTRNAAMLDSITEITDFVRRGGKNSFAFVFIDPTGWSGFDLKLIQPLLRQTPGEVLINFMTEHIRRFVTPKEKREDIIDSFCRLFGSDEVFDRVGRIPNAQDREDELFTAYAHQLRAVGNFAFTCPAVVFHAIEDRTHFHLIYATRHPRGVEVFKDVERKAFDFQEGVRADAEERKESKKSGQRSLFAEMAKPPSHRAVTLRERYLNAATRRIGELCANRKRVPFDEIWATAMAFPLVWNSDVKSWLVEWKKAGKVRIPTLKPRQRVPQVGEKHIVEFLN